MENSSADGSADLLDFAQLYRKICHFHSLARERRYSSYLVDRLGDLSLRGHQQLYRRKLDLRQNALQFILRDFPCLIRQQWKLFWLAIALLYLPGLLLLCCILLQPDWVYSVLSPAQVMNFELMYDPDNLLVGAKRDAGSNWMMFGFYIFNNIGIAFRVFATGIIFCVGSLFFLAYNSLLFGAVSGHLINVGYTKTFFTFVVAHGSFELTAIAIAGAGGLKLGLALLKPGNFSRREALARAARPAVQLVYGAAAMLLLAAFIEAFWSSNNTLAPGLKYAVGAVLWLIVFAWLGLAGRSRA